MRAWLLVALAALAGCNDDFAGGALVDGLRVLAIVAEPPEARPGETVTLHAYTIDTHGGAPAIAWSACTLPSRDGALDPACLDGGGDGRLALGAGDELTLTVPDVDLAPLGPPDGTGGVYLPIVARVSVPDDTVDAVYRLRVAGGGPRNTNPRFAAISPFNGALVQPAYPNDKLELVTRFANDSYEQYEVPDPEAAPGTRRLVQETLTVQWFATAGTFQTETTAAYQVEEFRLDRRVPRRFGLVDLWAVGHDERGGVTIEHHQLLIQ